MAWDRYVAPFSYSLWLAVATAVCALGVCLALTNYSQENHHSLNLIATVFYIPACFCQQGKVKYTYEFFVLSFVLLIAVLFFHFLPFWAFLILSSHSYLSFYAYPCIALIY